MLGPRLDAAGTELHRVVFEVDDDLEAAAVSVYNTHDWLVDPANIGLFEDLWDDRKQKYISLFKKTPSRLLCLDLVN